MTIIKHNEQRVGILFDAQNMYHSAKNLYKKKVNFKAVLKTAVADRKLVRAIAYAIHTETGEEKTFCDALVKLGIEVKTKDLQIFAGGMKKGDWDVGITIDAVRLSKSLDVIILISGDGDFVPLIEYLRNQGVQTEVMAFGKSASLKLKEIADDFIDLGENQKLYLL